jgi:hypothetical protein
MAAGRGVTIIPENTEPKSSMSPGRSLSSCLRRGAIPQGRQAPPRTHGRCDGLQGKGRSRPRSHPRPAHRAGPRARPLNEFLHGLFRRKRALSSRHHQGYTPAACPHGSLPGEMDGDRSRLTSNNFGFEEHGRKSAPAKKIHYLARAYQGLRPDSDRKEPVR